MNPTLQTTPSSICIQMSTFTICSNCVLETHGLTYNNVLIKIFVLDYVCVVIFVSSTNVQISCVQVFTCVVFVCHFFQCCYQVIS